MSPLAARLAKGLIDDSQSSSYWRENITSLRSALFDIHCFEITQSLPIITEVASSLHEKLTLDGFDDLIGKLCFLPAPKTWIEWIHPALQIRIALLLEQNKADFWDVNVTLFGAEYASYLGNISTKSGDFRRTNGKVLMPKEIADRFGVGAIDGFLGFCHNILLTINSPKIIGRRQFMPNRGLERKLIKGFGVGRFPLHAWTEIRLHVNKPMKIDDGLPHEAHLTGQRALHFVRKHIRIRLGKLEYVSAH
jgi:hypothetical protein